MQAGLRKNYSRSIIWLAGGGPNISRISPVMQSRCCRDHTHLSASNAHTIAPTYQYICQSESRRWRRLPDEIRSLPRHQRRPSSLPYSTRYSTCEPGGVAIWSRGGQVPDFQSHEKSRRRVMLGRVTPILDVQDARWTTVFEVRRRPG